MHREPHYQKDPCLGADGQMFSMEWRDVRSPESLEQKHMWGLHVQMRTVGWIGRRPTKKHVMLVCLSLTFCRLKYQHWMTASIQRWMVFVCVGRPYMAILSGVVSTWLWRREQEAREQELKRRLMENNIYAGAELRFGPAWLLFTENP